jgi:ATP-dependent Clp protease adaptor protein ClpS
MPQEATETPASSTSSASPQTATATLEKRELSARQSPLWNVVLLDDNDHTYEYVIEMLCTLFRKTPEEAFLVARSVDRNGRAICMTTHKELAELKREQITSFGADPIAKNSRGSMGAVIEPAFADDDSKGECENNDSGSSGAR